MSGAPWDGMPFWVKGIYYVVLTPMAIYDRAIEIKDKLKDKIRRKKK